MYTYIHTYIILLKLFNKDVVDEVVHYDGGDDPVQPCLIFSLPVIYFRNPVDPYNL